MKKRFTEEQKPLALQQAGLGGCPQVALKSGHKTVRNRVRKVSVREPPNP